VRNERFAVALSLANSASPSSKTAAIAWLVRAAPNTSAREPSASPFRRGSGLLPPHSALYRVSRTAGCLSNRPFSCSSPPNHAGTFLCTWLSSDLRRSGGRLFDMDSVVARVADEEGRTPLSCHERRPCELADVLFEAGEGADLVNCYLARFRVQLAPSSKEPVDQLLPRVGDLVGRSAVDEDRPLVSHQGYPAELSDEPLFPQVDFRISRELSGGRWLGRVGGNRHPE